MRRLIGAIAAAALMVVAAAGAASAVPHPEATFKSQRVYFHCSGDSKVQNVPANQGQTTQWNTTPPSSSVTDGAGCGQFDTGNVDGLPADPVFEGTFVGNVKSLTVHLHEMAHSDLQAFGTEVLVTLVVDGKQVLAHEGAQRVPAVSENSGVTNGVTFTVTGIGLDTEAGNGTTSHTFSLKIASPVRGASLWVWDTTEVPAGITFNPSTPAPTVFPAG